MTGSRWRSHHLRRIAPVVLVVLLAAAVALVVSRAEDPDPLEEARELAADPTGFDSGEEAAQRLALVAQHLNDAVTDCRASDAPEIRCQALSAASGYVQVLAGMALTCTAPGRFEARTRVEALLELVAGLDASSRVLPEPPQLPAC